MKLVKFVLILTLTAMSATSCLKEIAVQGVDSGELTLNPLVDLLTKAPIAGTEFPEDRTIVLSAYYNVPDGTSADFFQNITFKKEGSGNWTGGGGTNPKYWPVTGTLDLLAYSADGFSSALTPDYNSTNCSADVTLTVPDNSATQVDILWTGAQNQAASPTALAMTFKHAEAAVAFNAKAEVPYDATANLGITIDTITLKNVKSSGMVKLPVTGNCTWSGLDTPKDIVLPGIPTTGFNVDSILVKLDEKPFAIGNTGIIVLPQPVTSFTVNYTVHYGWNASGDAIDKEETFTYSIPTTPTPTEWTAGTKYVYSLEFKLDQILVATDIYDWTESSSGVPVPEPVSATYKNTDTLSIDLGAATLSAGGVVGIDWGSGRRQIIENTSTSAEMTISELTHTYSAAPSDSVKIHVRKGVLDFGTVSNTQYQRFHVYNSDEVKMTTEQWTLTLNGADNGDVTLSYPPEGTIAEGETESVYQKEKVTVNPVPDEHYVLDAISYNDGTSYCNITSEKSFAMPGANTSVTVTFKKKTYTLTANETLHGSFRLMDGTNEISSGSSIVWGTVITVVPTPDTGYVVNEVKYNDGTSDHDATLVTSSAYKFNMPTHDATVTVTFKIQVPGDPLDPLDSYDIKTWTTTP